MPALATITRPPNEIEKNEVYIKAEGEEEHTFYEAYRRHLHVSQVLAMQPGLEKEAYYELLFSIECFLKDLFCLARHASLGAHRTIQPGKFRAALSSKEFGHDLRAIGRLLGALVADLGSAPTMNALLEVLPPRPNWPSARYELPMPNDPEVFRQRLSDVGHRFEQLLKTVGALR